MLEFHLKWNKRFEKEFSAQTQWFKEYMEKHSLPSRVKANHSHSQIRVNAMTPHIESYYSGGGDYYNTTEDLLTNPTTLYSKSKHKRSKLSIMCQTNNLMQEEYQRQTDYILDGASSSLLPKNSLSVKRKQQQSSIDKRGHEDLVTSRSIYSFKQSVLSGIEDWDLPQTLQKMGEYIEKHPHSLKPSNLIKFCEHWVLLGEESKEFELEFHSKKMLGDLYVDLRKIDKAFEIYKSLSKFSEKHNKFKEKLLMLEQLGYWEHVIRKYKEAIIWFKKMLELAWYEKDTTSEMKAYGNMSREHFYLGDLDKAYYYHDRMIRGKAENGKSALKKMSYHVIKNKRDAKNEKNISFINSNKDRFKNHSLPSPRESNKTNVKVVPTVDVLPNYFVGEHILFMEAMKNHQRLLKGGLYGIETK